IARNIFRRARTHFRVVALILARVSMKADRRRGCNPTGNLTLAGNRREIYSRSRGEKRSKAMRNSLLNWIFPALLVCAAPAFAAVDVSFRDPDRFTDIEAANNADPKLALDELAKHLKRLGDRYLPADRMLSIEVLDVDLAGRVRWTREARQLRIVNDR